MRQEDLKRVVKMASEEAIEIEDSGGLFIRARRGSDHPDKGRVGVWQIHVGRRFEKPWTQEIERVLSAIREVYQPELMLLPPDVYRSGSDEEYVLFRCIFVVGRKVQVIRRPVLEERPLI